MTGQALFKVGVLRVRLEKSSFSPQAQPVPVPPALSACQFLPSSPKCVGCMLEAKGVG